MTLSLQMEISKSMAVVTLDRPHCRNALSRELLTAINDAIEKAVASGVRAVLLTGARNCFSAGADFNDLNGAATDVAFDEAVAVTVAAIRDAPVLAIAAIEGACLGAAFDIAMSCDLRVAAEHSFFELPALRLGILYNPSALTRMRRVLPASTLARLLLLGERIGGREARASGIADYIAPAGGALALATSLAERVDSASPQVLAATKRFVVAMQENEIDAAEWQLARMELLGAPERRDAILRAKAKKYD